MLLSACTSWTGHRLWGYAEMQRCGSCIQAIQASCYMLRVNFHLQKLATRLYGVCGAIALLAIPVWHVNIVS